MDRKFYEFTKYTSSDGVTFNFSTHAKFVIEESGLGMPPIEYTTQRSPNQHGETIIDYKFMPRVIQYILRRNMCTKAEYWNARTELLNVIRPRSATGGFALGKLYKRLPNGREYYIDVTVEEGPTFDRVGGGGKWDEHSYQTSVRFIAPDPMWYSTTQTCVVFTLSAASQIIFPITFPLIIDANTIDTTNNVTYAGSFPAYPFISITGPMTGFQVENITTGDIIKMNYVIAVGDRVTIDLRYPSKTIVNLAGENLAWAFSDDSDVGTFSIEPAPKASGGLNQIRVFGAGVSAASKVELSYYERFVGI